MVIETIWSHMMMVTAVLKTTLEGHTWLKIPDGGGDFEMTVLAHLLDTPVYSFQGDSGYWLSCFPHGIDRRLPVNVSVPSIYIILRSSHFEVVTAVRRRLTS